MRIPFIRPLAVMLVATITGLSAVQHADAMLVPAGAATQPSPQVDRAADLQTIQTTLESKMIRERLHHMGLTDTEIQSRLSHLSDNQIHQLASQIRAVHPAGEAVLIGVLVVVLLVVLIIYFIRRV